ncbi:DMT family transporter [Nonomuraea sp. NPDC049419]|uniref:EamA family transporter n=1 Tax=Nonomuraea sp. NPDC049419 TaxID=3155772 RepID=UPI003449B170
MRWAGAVLAVGSACGFAFSGPMAKYLVAGGMTPVEAVWVRLAGSGVLMVLVLGLFRPGALRIARSRWTFVGLYALTAVAAVQTLFFVAVTRLPVGIALLLVSMAPVLVVAWVRLVRRRRLPRSAYAGAVVAVAGLAIVVEAWREIRLDGLGLATGLLAAACSAGYFLMNESLGDEVDPLALIAWGTVGATVVLAPLASPWELPWEAFRASVAPGGVELPVLVAYLLMVVAGTVLPYVWGVHAVRRLSAAVAATMGTVEVIAGAVMAWGFVGETLGVSQIAGGVVVLCGAVLARRSHRAPDRVLA